MNLSDDDSRLVFARAAPSDAPNIAAMTPETATLDAALSREAALDYRAPTGRYWEMAEQFDPAALRAVDALWMDAFAAASGTVRPDQRVA